MTDRTSQHPTLQRIMVVTRELIQEKGCRHTTLQEIIKRTGLSKGAIYHYFQSKDELFALILKAQIEEINQRFTNQVDQTEFGDLKGPLAVISQGLFSTMGSEDVSSQIFIYLLSQKDKPEIAAVLTGLFDYTMETSSSWIEAGQKGGAIPQEIHPQAVAYFFMVMVYGLRVMKSIPGIREELNESQLFSFLFHTLRKDDQ